MRSLDNSQIMFLEGYLFDKEKGKAAFLEAARACHKGGGKAGIAISDPFCVERHRVDFLLLIENELDFVIGNEAEIKSLFETDDLEEALAAHRRRFARLWSAPVRVTG